ncbi:hypothetical protein DFQ27_000976 [Actinomortierella ambigua]|uniref:Uncharacterized protein n=1 Tax=Actinomortierella ambigua TaxID=1343610 RepID=A0A9P6QJ53_9FUNG|nr:hypothetical protein DFQ27_000976 [Actinomortierella ambigua]
MASRMTLLQHLAAVLATRYRIVHADTGLVVASDSYALSLRPASGKGELWDTPWPVNGTDIIRVKFRDVDKGLFVFVRFPEKMITLQPKVASSWLINNLGEGRVSIRLQSEPLFWTPRDGKVGLAKRSMATTSQEWQLITVQ